MRFGIVQVNAGFLINQLTKYFYIFIFCIFILKYWLLFYFEATMLNKNSIKKEKICVNYLSQIGPRSKKYWRKLETVCPYNFLRVKVFANFNTWAQDFLFYPLNIEASFSFIPSLKNAANVVLSSIIWFSFETVAFVMRMCLKMFLFPKIM